MKAAAQRVKDTLKDEADSAPTVADGEWKLLKRALGPFEVFRKRLRLLDTHEGRPVYTWTNDAGRLYYNTQWEGVDLEEQSECEDISRAMSTYFKARCQSPHLFSLLCNTPEWCQTNSTTPLPG